MNRQSNRSPIRLGVIGAGRAAERIHLPAIRSCRDCDCAWVADRDEAAAGALAAQFELPLAGTDFESLPAVDGVVVATPPASHQRIAERCLELGWHVLCEKPLTTRAQEAEALVDLAQRRGLILAVGLQRRYYPASLLVRRLISTGWLGGIRSIDAEEGLVYDWGPRTRFRAELASAGGGVLLDTGSHTLDRILWWLDGSDLRAERYADDSHGGPETDCELRFTVLAQGEEIPVNVILSRLRSLRNTFRIVAERGIVELAFNEDSKVTFRSEELQAAGNGGILLRFEDDGGPRLPNGRFDAAQAQIRDFALAISTDGAPRNAAASTLALWPLIDWCYDHRQPQAEPWVRHALDRRLLTSGGTGR